MRKAKPVIILLAIQLAFLLILTSTPYIRDALIRAYGDVYTFEIEEANLFGNDYEYVDCTLKYRPEIAYDLIGGSPEQYASVETDKNGISYLAEVSNEKPDGAHIGNEIRNKNFYDHFNYELPENFFYDNSDLFPDGWRLDNSYSVTADVYLYEGYLLPKQLYLNGTPIEEFSTKEKINEPSNNQELTIPDKQPAD